MAICKYNFFPSIMIMKQPVNEPGMLLSDVTIDWTRIIACVSESSMSCNDCFASKCTHLVWRQRGSISWQHTAQSLCRSLLDDIKWCGHSNDYNAKRNDALLTVLSASHFPPIDSQTSRTEFFSALMFKLYKKKKKEALVLIKVKQSARQFFSLEHFSHAQFSVTNNCTHWLVQCFSHNRF